MKQRLAVLSLFALASACPRSDAGVVAPLEGGEQLTYAVDLGHAKSVGTITFEKRGRGFLVKASSPGYAEQLMRFDLQDPGGVRAFGLGHIWLPPDHRGVHAESLIGEIDGHEVHRGRTMAVLEAEHVTRYYDLETGFLMTAHGLRMGMILPLSQLQASTVPGLQPVLIGRRKTE